MARTKEAIIRDLQRVESALSPENLHCDGEISRAQANRKRVVLEREKRGLIKELGREPTFQELWGI